MAAMMLCLLSVSSECVGQAAHWKAYAESEMEAGNQSQVKGIFSRSLLNCLSLALWQTYLRFIKQVRDIRLRKKFQFVLGYG